MSGEAATIAAPTDDNGGLCTAIAVDPRTSNERRFRDVLRGILAQLGEAPSVDTEEKARGVARLTLALDQFDAKLANGEPVDANTIVTAENARRRLLADLGLSRRRGRAK